jgi:hypothetical protein
LFSQTPEFSSEHELVLFVLFIFLYYFLWFLESFIQAFVGLKHMLSHFFAFLFDSCVNATSASWSCLHSSLCILELFSNLFLVFSLLLFELFSLLSIFFEFLCSETFHLFLNENITSVRLLRPLRQIIIPCILRTLNFVAIIYEFLIYFTKFFVKLLSVVVWYSLNAFLMFSFFLFDFVDSLL